MLETFKPRTDAPIGDTLGLVVGQRVDHRMDNVDARGVIESFLPGWDETCPATVVIRLDNPEAGNVRKGIFQCGARWVKPS